MIDKSLVKKRFRKSLDTYDENAIIQKQTAKKLTELLPKKEFNVIFETGCATGILTKEIVKNLKFNEFYANDIVEESKEFIEKIVPNCKFIQGDIEETDIKRNFDLIISNACLQWCNNIENTIDKLMKSLNNGGILAISIFGDGNLKEITQIFGIENKAYSMDSLKKCLSKYKVVEYREESLKLYFDKPVDVLKHLKLTGTNAIRQTNLTKSKLKDFEEQYTAHFSENNRLCLTFNPVYIILEKQTKEQAVQYYQD